MMKSRNGPETSQTSADFKNGGVRRHLVAKSNPTAAIHEVYMQRCVTLQTL